MFRYLLACNILGVSCILCPVTSYHASNELSVSCATDSFSEGEIARYIRANKANELTLIHIFKHVDEIAFKASFFLSCDLVFVELIAPDSFDACHELVVLCVELNPHNFMNVVPDAV